MKRNTRLAIGAIIGFIAGAGFNLATDLNDAGGLVGGIITLVVALLVAAALPERGS